VCVTVFLELFLILIIDLFLELKIVEAKLMPLFNFLFFSLRVCTKIEGNMTFFVFDGKKSFFVVVDDDKNALLPLLFAF
jgi:hypothetical protein